MASFQILSDLHLKSPSTYNIFNIPPKAPYLTLLEDIGNVHDKGFFPFIKAQLRNFRTVFFLMGNHELYHCSWDEARRKINMFECKTHKKANLDPTSGLGTFVFLDHTRHDMPNNIMVLGCTLYSHIPSEHKERVSFSLNDFYLINNWAVKGHNATHAADLMWLNEQVAAISASEPQRKIVIFTHHSPIMQDERAVDPGHIGSVISSRFATDLSREECWKNLSVQLWVLGHTHFNFDFVVDAGEGPGKCYADRLILGKS
ncbi:ser/Thr protein phosphatase superfamily protein [Coccidioides immitis RMSCC 2394]|uniref:Ser/Thr protein phosphatase superfamily protein n=1 Tax=Coccidioides immitis RMSCC 2394 TaxID=404692 RepID=A0A0J6YEQ0_COCIT|nr:ser/Thr protein phosphatase superfamily protein [Coccidioides immitis RMSCC 2394]